MINVRWYVRVISTIIVCLVGLFFYRNNDYLYFCLGSISWNLFDQIVYSIRFKRF